MSAHEEELTLDFEELTLEEVSTHGIEVSTHKDSGQSLRNE